MHLRTWAYTFYTSRYRPIKFLVSLPGSCFRVDNEKVQLYITLEFFYFFILLLQVLVIWFLRFVCDFRLRLL